MKEYTVTIRLSSAEEFARLIDTIGPVANARFSVNELQGDAEPIRETAAPRKQRTTEQQPRERKQRVSKVNNKILETLNGGQATVKEMKAALEQAGFAPGSLSTALSNLQKDGTVVRVEEGVYQLAQAA